MSTFTARKDAIKWLSTVIADMTGPYPDLVATEFDIATKKMAAAIEEMRAERAALTVVPAVAAE